MNRTLIIKALVAGAGLIVLAVVAVTVLRSSQDAEPPVPQTPRLFAQRDFLEDTDAKQASQTLKLLTPTLAANERMDRAHSCNGSNASPGVRWSDAPAGTKSMVVLFERIDGNGDTPLQWSVYNIPVKAGALEANLPKTPSLPNGMGQGINDLVGNTGYVGPCIAKGKLHYRLRLFALDIMPNLPGGAKREDIMTMMNGHVLDVAEMPLMYFYRL